MCVARVLCVCGCRAFENALTPYQPQYARWFWMETGSLSLACCGRKSFHKNKLDQPSHGPVQYARARDAPLLARSVDIGWK